jgi:hypothetical protein
VRCSSRLERSGRRRRSWAPICRCGTVHYAEYLERCELGYRPGGARVLRRSERTICTWSGWRDWDAEPSGSALSRSRPWRCPSGHTRPNRALLS